MDHNYEYQALKGALGAKISQQGEAKECATQNLGGILGLRDVSDFRYSLNRRIEEAVGAAHSADKLMELRGLLDRNPETARILELMREMGV